MRRNCATIFGNRMVSVSQNPRKVRHLMLKRPFKSLIARIAIIALALSLVVPFVPAAFAQDTSLSYAENGTAPVATFFATDQDDDPIEWSISGADAMRFTIDGGVLAFKKSPNYESPNSESTGTLADRNAYNVTIEATGGTHAVVVNVTNVDEAGEVSLTKPQPQVGRGLAAALEDPDGGQTDEKWQWARSEDGETWADIEGAKAQSRNPTADDVGSFLRATVVYADSFGNGKTAMVVSDNRVEARTVANASPSFSDQDEIKTTRTYVDVSRSVGENTAVGGNVGKPVSASDGDSDVLIYSLVDTPDLEDSENKARFTIDSSSGQIKVGKKLGADAANDEAGAGTTTEEREDEDSANFADLSTVPELGTPAVDPRVADNSMYVLIVRATDPSGADADVNVVVTVNELAEAPAFAEAAPTTLWVTEKAEDKQLRTAKADPDDGGNDLVPAAYAATDDDDEVVTYAVVQPEDEEFFSITTDAGVLTVATDHSPNYEEQASYQITIVASSGEGDDSRKTRLNVTVKVVDAEDDGEVMLSQLEPQVGRTVIASLIDPDGGETVSAWQWYRNVADPASGSPTGVSDLTGAADTACAADTTEICAIPKAKSAAYTPTDDDNTKRLAALVTYTDNIGDDEQQFHAATQEAVQQSEAENAAPLFPDQDPNTSGDQSDGTSREIAENTKAKQSIGAPVGAGDEDGDAMLYTLGGSDADSFSIERETGQLKTKAKLDFESQATYMVVVTASDPSGAGDSILVTINLTDEDDAAAIAGASSLSYAENGTGPVATFSATDQDDDPIEWSISGADAMRFTIDGGVLAFKKSPNYESPNSESTGTLADRNAYNVTIEATGGTHAVVVNVTNVDEAGEVSLTKPQPQVGRGLAAALEDPDGGQTDEKWQWARSEDGETWADIEGAKAQSRNPTADDVGSFLRATVVYADSFGNGKTAMVVSDNRVEARTVANASPSFSDQDEIKTTRTYVDVSRSVGENTAVGGNVGKPVSASDGDSDVLIYSLVDTPDLEDSENKARFTIDSSSGQIKVGKKLGADAANDEAGAGTTTEEREDEDSANFADLSTVPELGTPAVDPRVADNSMYVLIVRATDPSGADADVNVVVTVNELAEAPAFAEAAPTTLWVTEKAEDKQLRTAKADPDDGGNDLVPAAYAATDDDDEVVTYAVVQPEDEEFFSITTDAGVLTVATDHSPNYEEQASYQITIVASSGEGDDSRKTRLNVTVKVVDAEDDGEVMLSQLEPQVGRTVIASLIDPDGGETVSAWQWYRNVADPASGSPTGVSDLTGAADTACAADTTEICAIPKAKSAAYTPTDDDNTKRLAALVTYTDNIGDDEQQFHAATQEAVQQSEAENAAPLFPDQDPNTSGDQSDGTSREIAENTKAKQSIGAPVGAGDEDGDAMLYTLGGSDADSFSIERETGQLKTKAKLDFESQATYMVVVTASDPSGAGDSILVTINVTDEDDGATITLTPPTPEIVAMDGAVTLSTDDPAVGEAITATLEDGNEVTDLTWQWASSADGAEYADIEGATEASYTPTNDVHATWIRATATYSDDSSDEAQTASATAPGGVNNAPAFAAETASISVDENAEAMAAVGDPIVATDANEEELEYTITGDDAASFEIWPSGQITVAPDASIDFETQTSYSVTVTATDAMGASDSIDVTIAVNDLGLPNAYDADDSGDIDKDEAVKAVQDYFADTITRGEALEVLQLYFAG